MQAPGWSFEATMEATEVLKRKIMDTSQKSQEVLLLLLSDNDDLRQRLGQEVTDRKRETRELRDWGSSILTSEPATVLYFIVLSTYECFNNF